ncbi:MAG: hypothetical protein ING66_05075 [Rhodocyclaceae bacterium]|nr:hypothetical protein [Rhodocyclaceae bacterium]
MANEAPRDQDATLTKSEVSVEPGLLVELTRALLPYLGPYSITTVKRVARTTSSPTELIRQIACYVDDVAKRELFMKAAARILSEYSAPGVEEVVSAPPSPAGGRPPSPMTPELIQRGEAALASIIGPLAGVLVSRHASASENSREFFEQLATHLRTPQERDRFFMSVRSSNGTWRPE